MQYMVIMARSDEEWEALSPSEQDMEGIGRWWGELVQQGVVVSGCQLQPARSATTVRWRNGKPLVSDGPFVESKETIAGFGILDVPDLDAALAIARTWPAQSHAVEIRPVVPNR